MNILDKNEMVVKNMWKKSGYTKKEINDAGKQIINKNLSSEERKRCIAIIDNWRAAHAYPMNTFAIHLKHLVGEIPNALVVQRLKRLDTIIKKLERFPSMQLYRMQDLGGCRVIVPKIEDVYNVVSSLRKSRIRHIEHNYKDYIATPNPNTGYRGYHLIYNYKSDKKTDYNGMQVEVQIRTQLQHLWATAVETVGLFTDNGLKFNQGSQDWLQFFKYASALFAIEEMSALPEGISTNPKAIISDLLKLNDKLNAIDTMWTIGMATQKYMSVEKKKNKVDIITWEGYSIYVNKHIIPFYQEKKLKLSEDEFKAAAEKIYSAFQNA